MLKNLIPSKELRRIMGLNSSIGAKENLDNQQSMSVKQKLEQLSDLKAEGLISGEEFLEQKKENTGFILNIFVNKQKFTN